MCSIVLWFDPGLCQGHEVSYEVSYFHEVSCYITFMKCKHILYVYILFKL